MNEQQPSQNAAPGDGARPAPSAAQPQPAVTQESLNELMAEMMANQTRRQQENEPNAPTQPSQPVAGESQVTTEELTDATARIAKLQRRLSFYKHLCWILPVATAALLLIPIPHDNLEHDPRIAAVCIVHRSWARCFG